MKIRRSVSLDTELIEKIEAAAKLRRESASKWLEDAAIQRLQRVSQTEEKPDDPPPPSLPTKPRRPTTYRNGKMK